jgi:penicillin amidase
MRHALLLVFAVLSASWLVACEGRERDLIRDLPVSATFHAAALQKEAHVVRTEADVPHIYAATRHDAAYVLGFTTARDRFFMMDLARRLGTGKVTELLGSAGLESDLRSRLSGMTYLTDQVAAHFSPTLQDHADGYVAGVNDYIAAVRTGALPAPSEFEIVYPFLGASGPADLMQPFEPRDLAALVAVTIYNSSFEPGDVRHAALAATLSDAFKNVPDEVYRKAGLDRDIWSPVVPLFPVASAPSLGTSYGQPFNPPTAQGLTSSHLAALPKVNKALVRRLDAALEAMQVRMNRDRTSGYGSNSWAVAGFATADGNAVMAGDGHLSLAIPSILYQFGIDTTVFGDGDLHQLGLTIPGFMVTAIGTNGKVAWSQTQLGEDITDWFAELIQLDGNGVPVATKWGDQWMPVVRVDESFTIAGIPALGSKAGTETWSRFETFDGRRIADFEGRPVKIDDVVDAGETKQYGMAGFIVPGDADGDGVVTAVSYAYAGLYAAETLASTDALGHANSVEEFRQGMRGLVGYSQNFAVADSSGNIMYSSYQAVPCRRALPRNPDGSFVAGADPTLLLDGTQYGNWRIPTQNGVVDESVGETDAQACVVPFDKVPMSINPNTGYVVTANNDPGGLSLDGSIFNDEVYLGGPWDEGYRADTISRALKKEIASNTAGVEGLARVQANIDSRLGELFVPDVIAAIARAKTQGPSDDPAAMRLAAIYLNDSAAFDEAGKRLAAWRDAGYQAHGGVHTFYRNPTAADVQDAIATMIFNAWVRKFIVRVIGDEGIDDIWGSVGGETQVRILKRLLEGRGDTGMGLLGSWEPTRRESVFFDDLATPGIIETSDEDILNALEDGMAFLRSAPTTPGVGGFGTADMSKWIWGLRHQVVFDSLIADYVNDPALAVITNQLQINTSVLPLAPPGEDIPSDDPRSLLQWFPRDGDQYGVDAANPGLGGDKFTHGSGPVMRMVFELSSSGVIGQNVIPGGQSGITDSPHFADQARMWLANKAYPARFSPSDVAHNSTGHELFLPAGEF